MGSFFMPLNVAVKRRLRKKNKSNGGVSDKTV